MISVRRRLAFVLLVFLSHISLQTHSFLISDRVSLCPVNWLNDRSRKTSLTAHPSGSGSGYGRKNFQLKKIAQSIERLLSYRKTPFDDEKGRALVDVLSKLAQASTKAESIEASRQLQALPLVGSSVAPSTSEQAILERVIRAAALSGLDDLAWNYTVTGFLNWDMIPSSKTQDALSTALRRSGELELFKEFMTRSGNIVTRKESVDEPGQQPVSLISFNMFLACMCEEKKPRWQRNKGTAAIVEERLNEALSWLSNDSASECLGVTPDAVSYSTVMHAAASVNRTVADVAWTLMLQQQIIPDIFAYNARLRAVLQASKSQQSDQDAIFLWDDQISKQPTLTPDQYTLDFILPPLLRAGRIGDVEDLLDRFVSKNSENIVSNAFAAFLVSLIQDGELASARAIFEMYMAPSLSSVVAAIAGEMRLVRPRTRHFNILLEGYRKQWQSHTTKKMAATDSALEAVAIPKNVVNEAWDLFGLMQKSSAKVDAYTITTMMGLCRTPDELSELLFDAFASQQIACSGVVARAAISAFGSLRDPSSACWFCFKFYGNTRLTSVRTLNVLMGAFAESAAFDYPAKLSLDTSAVARRLKPLTEGTDRRGADNCDFLAELRCQQAARSLLEEMTRRNHFLPKPDSQTFCLAASTLQFGKTDPSLAVELFRNATRVGITPDGRFINAIFRCFGDDVDAAITAWKKEIRTFCISHDLYDRKSPASQLRAREKNLFAAYNGLLFVCGRARRSDIALRVVYAMKKEGLEPSELSLNCYNSGKRRGSSTKEFSQSWLTKRIKLADPYESLLYVECMKYDKNDRRRSGEKRVRIIV